MPSSEKHILGYFIFLVIGFFLNYHYNFLENITTENVITFALVGVVFSIFPDLDIGNSKMRKWSNRILAISLLIFLFLYLQKSEEIYLLGIGGIAGIFLLLSFAKHGRIMHSILLYLIFAVFVGYFYNFYAGAGLLFGAMSHIVLDGVF